MTPQEIARAVVEEFADKARDYIWGADHMRHKGADETLAEMVAAAIANVAVSHDRRTLAGAVGAADEIATAAERERCAKIAAELLDVYTAPPGELEVASEIARRIRGEEPRG